MQLRRKLHDWFLAALGICAGILSPIAILVLLSAAFIPWWEATLSKHRWPAVVLVLIVPSRWLVGGLLYYRVGKYLDYLRSPEGKRRRAAEVQAAAAEILADARRFDSHTERNVPVGSALFSGAEIMTEAHRLAKKIAKSLSGEIMLDCLVFSA